jgi:predicted ATP-grasp superfamily ATP-dependent carboligase
MKYDAIVLDAGLRQSLVTVRSLGRRGLNVLAVDTTVDVPPPAFSSRWCRRGVTFSAPDATDAYLDQLEELLRASPARVVITSHDGTIAMLRRYRDRIQARARVALADDAALGIAVSKERTLEVAQRLGLRAPRAVALHTADDVPRMLREIGLPAVVKPDESWLSVAGQDGGAWAGPRLVATEPEAHDAVDRLTRLGGIAVCQQFLTGRREAVSFFYARGTIHARFAQWARRTFPPLGGTSVLRQSILPPDDIGDRAEALIREINLEGYSEVEFRRDGAGVPYLMEINPRLSASVEIAVRAGVDFPYLLYLWAAGEPVPHVEGYRVGGWMRHLGGDVMTTLESIQERGRPDVAPPLRALLDFGTAFFQPMRYDYADGADPLPAISATAHFTRAQMGRVFSRIRRSFT